MSKDIEKDFEKVRDSIKEEVVAFSILHKSVDHRWYEFLGNAITVKHENRDIEIKAGTCFGLKPTAIGYDMETDIMHQGPIPINTKDGYTLVKLSRELSKRQARWKRAMP